MEFVRVAGAQLDLAVGDLGGNRDKILNAMQWAEQERADLLLLPELAITGYPPEDLLLREDFLADAAGVLDELAKAAGKVVTVIGIADVVDPEASDDSVERGVANAAALLAQGQLLGVYHKVLLPNYGVFDEARYFLAGTDPARLFGLAGAAVGISVCEDIWAEDGPPARQAAAGAQLLLNLNASPYHLGKGEHRQRMLSARAREAGVPLVYVNTVGGQDELVFDGDSMVFDRQGGLLYRAAQFQEEMFVIDLSLGAEAGGDLVAVAASRRDRGDRLPPPEVQPRLEPDAEVYSALVTGLRDYVRKNGFQQVVLGLSGGIDSALTAAIAVDALGPEAVWTVTMPSRYSSPGSVDDSRELASRLHCRFSVLPIDGVFTAYLEALAEPFAQTTAGTAEENLQARIRGAILMALSNRFGHLVLTTGNKSETAVGYATLYGDMAGGFSVLKDLFKGWVYRLARWRNLHHELIPQAILDKPPSAELRPGQLDADVLPPYPVLDPILELYVEQARSIDAIVAEGFERETVTRVTAWVDANEYKRRQAPPGVKITARAFGKDRRLPITNRYNPGATSK